MITCELTGNLGNHLFELWSLAGIAEEHGLPYCFPDHEIFNYTQKLWEPKKQSEIDISPFRILPEKEYTFHEWLIDDKDHYILHGYRQSEKYWTGDKNKEKVLREMFYFKEEFIEHCRFKIGESELSWTKPTICISIRRGDFVGNPVYFQLPITYYIGALLTHFPDFRENYNLLFLSDDIEYCRVHFECLPNAYFATGCNAIEQLCLGSLCDHHIISNSTFSWWCAYLADNDEGKVIRPLYNFGDDYRKTHPEHDYWPDRNNWIVFDHIDYKIPLPDTTFMIPVFYDHPDRKQNLDLTVCMLQRDFRLDKSQIIIMENNGVKFTYHEKWCRYVRSSHKWFHRTKMLNDMAIISETSVIINWDADVFIAPMQIREAVRIIKNDDAHFVYPYDGRFARVIRKDGLESSWYKSLCKYLDVGIFRNITHFGKKGKQMAHSSVGGAIVMNKEKFIESGMENEYMISYAPEDCERWDRWHALGYNVHRVKGKLYHMDHFCGTTSSSKNPYFAANHLELDKIRAMHPDMLRKYVATWQWAVATWQWAQVANKNILQDAKDGIV